jgi:uncharacterized membrane protein
MQQITKYFNAEKYVSVLFVMVGLIAILVAICFLIKVNQPFYKGIAYPLIAVALIQIVVGSSVYFSSQKDILRVNELITANKTKI